MAAAEAACFAGRGRRGWKPRPFKAKRGGPTRASLDTESEVSSVNFGGSDGVTTGARTPDPET